MKSVFAVELVSANVLLTVALPVFVVTILRDVVLPPSHSAERVTAIGATLSLG
jgi:hypothetical protein